jgi:hypothetical protein
MGIAELSHYLERQKWEVFITQRAFIEHLLFAHSRLILVGIPEMWNVQL